MKGLINDSLIFALILFSYTWAHNPPYAVAARVSTLSRVYPPGVYSDPKPVQFCVNLSKFSRESKEERKRERECKNNVSSRQRFL